MRRSLLAIPFVCFAASFAAAQEEGEDLTSKWGHSRHGAAYDEGPRRRPWIMEGIGESHFPVTSSHPEVQQWFDQGHTLLHSFWYFEAERSFRWCLKLDPDCAMAYWGLARAVQDPERSRTFLEEALARKEGLTPRELAYLKTWQAKQAIAEAEGGRGTADEKREARRKATHEFVVSFDKLLMDHTDDIEAKSLYWLEVPDILDGPEAAGLVRYGMEAVLQQVLAKDPDHVGALHYRIHNWDGKEGRYGIESCLKLSEVAPESGHLQHMPGHVLSGIGLWHEAAIAMDSATRVEKRYMHDEMILPEDNWDYVHNLDYLCYIQEQLGLYEAALTGAKQLLLAPPSIESSPFGDFQKGPIVRAMLKFEKWDDLLSGELIDWGQGPMEQLLRHYAEARAHLGLKDLDRAEASFESLREALAMLREGPPGGGGEEADPDPMQAYWMNRMKRITELYELEIEALLSLAKGESLEGIELLTKAAQQQEEVWMNDPPQSAYFLYNVLGEAYLELGSLKLAAAAFEKTLETVFHDGFALSGLVRCYSALGEMEKAGRAMTALDIVWSDADPSNRWLEAARATGIEPSGESPFEIDQRSFQKTVLDVQGHSLWTPPIAPELSALDSLNRPVTLSRFEGKNVLLIFYLGDECLHCMEQINKANELVETFRALDTEIVAISKDSTAEIADYEKSGKFEITLLSDPGFENARRFHSYDDFEDIELHSTILIDTQGRVHWAKTGGEPFMNFDYLEKEARRLHEGVISKITATGGD
ncbi:MAG: redoxin domain-containing protein [Planctomycetota bacterium]